MTTTAWLLLGIYSWVGMYIVTLISPALGTHLKPIIRCTVSFSVLVGWPLWLGWTLTGLWWRRRDVRERASEETSGR